MTKTLGPRGWRADVWGEVSIFAVRENRGKFAAEVFGEGCEYGLRFKDIKIRRCTQLDALPEGFKRWCGKQSSGWYGGDFLSWNEEDRVWMAGLGIES